MKESYYRKPGSSEVNYDLDWNLNTGFTVLY